MKRNGKLSLADTPGVRWAAAVACLVVIVWAGCDGKSSSKREDRGPSRTTGRSPSADNRRETSSGGDVAANADRRTVEDESKPASGRDVLKRMVAAYQKASSYADAGEVHMVAEADGKKLTEQTANFSVALERPNKARLLAYQAMLVCDGKKLFAAINQELPGQVLLKPAPPKLTMGSVYGDLVLTQAMEQRFAGAMPQVMLLLADDPMEILLHGAKEPLLAPPGKVEERDCYCVEITTEPLGTAKYWIDRETYALRRVELPTDEIRRSMSQGQPIDRLSLVADFRHTQFDGQIDPTAFAYEVPKGAEVVDFFLPPHMGQLLSKKVPDFRFTDVIGKPVTPETLAGKVAVFDFWSIQFEPSKQSLQNLESLYQRYKDNRKVAFYAVCLDPPELKQSELNRVMDDLKVHVPVLRDPDMSAIGFKLTPPPVMFIIDAKGIVQHCDGNPNPEPPEILQSRIDKVLAGEDVYQEPLAQYLQFVEELRQYARTANLPVAQAEPKAADRSEPKTLKLTRLWKCADVKSPGNCIAIGGAGRPARLLVVDDFRRVAEIDLAGKLVANYDLDLAAEEKIGFLRVATPADGKPYIAAFFWGQQRCHVLDDRGKLVLHYPADALQHRHSGLTDVELGDLDGDGNLKLYVSYAGVAGVHAATLDGKRLWRNGSIAHVDQLAIGGPDKDGRRHLFCVNNTNRVAVLDGQGQSKDVDLLDRRLGWLIAADLGHDNRPRWCGLTGIRQGEAEAVGVAFWDKEARGEELWTYKLPAGHQYQPIEPLIAGQVTRQGPGQWLLPGPDGSIHIISADGKPLDKFNHGALLHGLAVVEISGQRALVVTTADGVEAWKVE